MLYRVRVPSNVATAYGGKQTTWQISRLDKFLVKFAPCRRLSFLPGGEPADKSHNVPTGNPNAQVVVTRLMEGGPIVTQRTDFAKETIRRLAPLEGTTDRLIIRGSGVFDQEICIIDSDTEETRHRQANIDIPVAQHEPPNFYRSRDGKGEGQLFHR